jgi:hypothetical protein
MFPLGSSSRTTRRLPSAFSASHGLQTACEREVGRSFHRALTVGAALHRTLGLLTAGGASWNLPCPHVFQISPSYTRESADSSLDHHASGLQYALASCHLDFSSDKPLEAVI